MTDSTTQLGVLTNIQQKPGKNGSDYVTAWIERRLPREVFLHQNNLVDKAQVTALADGQMVFFNSVSKKLDKGERIDAVNCSLAQPATLQEHLLALDIPGRRQLIHRATSVFRNNLLVQLELLLASPLAAQQEASLSAFRDELLRKETARTDLPVDARNPVAQVKPATSLSPVEGSPFMRHLFTANSPAYIARLSPVLVEGIRAIADDDAFQQALLLINVNAELAEGSKPDLINSFYLLASPAYRFQFWLRSLVPYCDTDTLLSELANGSEAQRKNILLRCQQNPDALLTGAAQPDLAPSVPVPIIQACFQNIKAALLEQLSAAQTSIRVAVAWFTHNELFDVLYEKLQQNVEVELIINNDYINNGEAGLPFDKFIESGGKLYLSEHPAMMHHKFCLIDEAILFNGSYNWTYYADLYNEENVLCVQDSPQVLASFKEEFERLKQDLGGPVTSITRFTAGEVARFERIGFREYLSKDIHSRVAHTRKTRPSADPMLLAALLRQAIEIDESNDDAYQLLQAVEPDAVIEGYAIRAKQAAQPQSSVAAPQLPVSVAPQPAKPEPAPTTPAPGVEASASLPNAAVLPSTPAQQPQAKPAAPQPLPTVPTPSPVSQSRSASLPRAVAPATARPINPAPALTQSSPNASVSMPDTQRAAAQYENLRLVFALDYSNSMESYNEGRSGYKLYSTGRIQQVINMIFGVAKGLTASEKVDVFLFKDEAVQLPEITDINYVSYVDKEVRKHEMGGTNIYAPIRDIHDEYAGASAADTKVFVILITDGENSDVANNANIKSYFAANPATPIFWQFVGLGAKFDFLEDVANTATNAGFFKLSNVQSVSDEALIDMLLQKFPQWYQ